MQICDKIRTIAREIYRAEDIVADKTVLDSWVNNYTLERAEQALTIARELDDQALLARALTACASATVCRSTMYSSHGPGKRPRILSSAEKMRSSRSH